MTDTKKAARTRLAPGEHSIDRVTAKPTASGGQMIEWSVRLHDGRLIAGKRTQARTAGDARAKARRIADELLAAGGGDWKRSSRIVDYLDQVTKPAIENNTRLRVNSRDRYLNVLPYIREALDGHVIDTAMKFRTLEKALQDVLAEVRLAVADFPAMRARAEALLGGDSVGLYGGYLDKRVTQALAAIPAAR